jgi:hypothetical protein
MFLLVLRGRVFWAGARLALVPAFRIAISVSKQDCVDHLLLHDATVFLRVHVVNNGPRPLNDHLLCFSGIDHGEGEASEAEAVVATVGAACLWVHDKRSIDAVGLLWI